MIRRYALALASSALATLATVLIAQHGDNTHPIAAFLAAILITGWYGGCGPALAAFALALTIDRFIPIFVGHPVDWGMSLRDVWFAVFAAGAAWFGTVRRQTLAQLQTATDLLETQVLERTVDLRRKDKYLNEAFRLAHMGYWAVKLNGESTCEWPELEERVNASGSGKGKTTADYIMAALHPDDRERVIRARDEAMERRARWELVFRIVLPDGEVRYIHSVGSPFLSEDGEVREYVGVVLDITDRRRVARALRKSRERRLRAEFAARLEERNRLAREMHDTLLQGFTGVSLKLLAATNRIGATQADVTDLRAVVGIAENTLKEARAAIGGMRSPVVGDLPEILRNTAQETARDAGIELDFLVHGNSYPISDELRAATHRIASEAMINAAKHSGATRVSVHLTYREHAMRLSVEDNGRGFAASASEMSGHEGHYGVIGMRERAAEVGGLLRISSKPRLGTKVVFRAPTL